MSHNYLGIISSVVFVTLILLISKWLADKGLVGEEGTRKFVHIGVSNYWLIAMHFFETPFWASVVPFSFILVNYYSFRFSVIPSMERTEAEATSLGTVYYPISLTILALWSFSPYSSPYVGALGMLSMGYGDGLAGLVGSKWGKTTLPIINKQKTVLGTATMFAMTWLVLGVVLGRVGVADWLTISLFLAIMGTLIELVSPKGLDNLTLPLGISFLYQLLFY